MNTVSSPSQRGPLLGCIADDFTGAADLASMLARGGMRTVQAIGVPDAAIDDVDAVVVALKSRTIAPEAAVAQSMSALRWLQQAGCRQLFFKYCSTFDSTPRGNIGPVADALAEALSASIAIACPAFPENRRTVYQGHLFVGDQLLSESGMRDHPLTPMTDANLVRVLQAQSRRRVGLVPHATVARGAAAIEAALRDLASNGTGLAIVDAIADADLLEIGRACRAMPLVTGGSGVAMGLPRNFADEGQLPHASTAEALPAVGGRAAVVSGSCSVATRAQVASWRQAQRPSFRVDPRRLARGDDVVGEALRWAADELERGPVLVSATAEPAEVRDVQRELGVERAGALIEEALARIAVGLVGQGVRRLVVAGGETSGAVVQALGVRSLRIGPAIAPGVPWTLAQRAAPGAAPLALALKSGNFGGPAFFDEALARCA